MKISSHASLLAAALLVGAAGCAPSTESPRPAAPAPTTPPPDDTTAPVHDAVHVVQTRLGATSASLQGLLGSVMWGTYSQELIDRLAPIQFTVPLDPYLNPDDELTLMRLAQCAQFYLPGQHAHASVALPADTSDGFSIPINGVPLPALAGDAEAQLAVGGVVLFEDGNGNSALDLAPLGAPQTIDTVVAASYAIDEDTPTHGLVLYRRGALSPVWKLFAGFYDCATTPPQGFSTVHITFADDGMPVCTVSETLPLQVNFSDSHAMRSLACEDDPDANRWGYPEGPIPADAIAQCDGWDIVHFTNTPDAACPIIRRYDLVGCSDMSSPTACGNTLWDLTEDPPSWWPCSNGGAPRMTLQDAPGDVDSGRDVLFTLSFESGVDRLPLERLRVEISTGDDNAPVVITGAENLLLDDEDGNGWFSAGDWLEVVEPTDLFNESTEPGYYQVHLVDGDRTVFTAWNWTPRPIPAIPEETIEIRVEDGIGPFTDGPDELFTLHYVAGSGSYALAELSVSVAWSCEVPTEFTAPTGVRLRDLDGDGRFGPLDALEVFEAEQHPYAFHAQDAPSFHHCVSLRVRRGVNLQQGVAHAVWQGVTVVITDALAPVGSGAEALFSVELQGHRQSFAAADLTVTIHTSEAYTQVAELQVGSGLTLEDRDGDGRYSHGDLLHVAEPTPLDGLASAGVYRVSIAAGDQWVGSGTWDAR